MMEMFDFGWGARTAPGARDRLDTLIGQTVETGDPFVITRGGDPKAILISVEEYWRMKGALDALAQIP